MGGVSALLLDLPFPLAGPLPPWRAAFSWIALVPLLYAILDERCVSGKSYLLHSAAGSYFAGVAWYVLNCYWIYATMHIYGHIAAPVAVGILILYSLVLGLYFGLFGLVIALVRRTTGSRWAALLLAPFLWVAIEFLSSRLTSVPWDQFGYTQVDNLWLTRLAPFTGVYGISFVLVAVNAMLAGALVSRGSGIRIRLGVGAALLAILLQLGSFVTPKKYPTTSTAVMLQGNLDVDESNDWIGPEWDENVSRFLELSERTCTPWIAGIPQTGAKTITPQCPANPAPANVIVWPESPSPFREADPRFQTLMATLARTMRAPVIAGNIAIDQSGEYNAATFVAPDGNIVGHYAKIHLVPFGEYVPYRNVLFFAGHLTQNISDFTRGKYRKVFQSQGHLFGIFICYESIFADEVRRFALNGAEVLVNISDDGWYGDTSAPWQHFNMARMRAIENNRWILRDGNDGVTAAIDPQGRVEQSAPRHQQTSLAVRYGYMDGLTFYTRHGDLFAMLCGIISLAALARALRVAVRQSSRKRQVS